MSKRQQLLPFRKKMHPALVMCHIDKSKNNNTPCIICYSLTRFEGLSNESSGNPLRFVPGKLLVRMSLSSWLTRRCGYSTLSPSNAFELTLSPVLKNGSCSACAAVRRFAGSYSRSPDSSLYPSCPSELSDGEDPDDVFVLLGAFEMVL